MHGTTCPENVMAVLTDLKTQDPRRKATLLENYLKMLKEKRRWAGLASSKAAHEPWDLVIDSLGVIKVIGCRSGLEVADLGAGGGIVGLVMAIVCETIEVCLIESSSRKCAFLAEAVGSLGIRNAEVLCDRVENLHGRRSFNCVVSRAAGRLVDTLPAGLPILRPGGIFVAVKGGGTGPELEEARELFQAEGVRLEEPGGRELKDAASLGRASLVVVRKV